ncbi:MULTISPECIES: rhodanese-like domain-containing protein [Methylobacillus]|uniref:Rhodanese-like protein n=1 Tax=Methylobacillus flagellatus (strain ATCC 51484 / DSM 6875 / VKM B-1610 / KT) TaxID=265072 RepID=Q1GXG4_METFK|nr:MULTISPECIES: rhodanese-like domain-containing protein [Methylobacillus]ABE48365.1 Rhodanese-like protein [Methylobacillus flagellatus KT]MPS48158.1 rhodanese-like domain-containing protein [Methylobacillus sp.]
MTSHTDIDATELHALLASRKTILVDVRNDDEVARGVIEGAMHLPMMVIPSMGSLLCEHHDTALVFYCHSGIRSAQAAAFIAGMDRENVYNLRGGILAWANAGYTFVPKTD